MFVFDLRLWTDFYLISLLILPRWSLQGFMILQLSLVLKFNLLSLREINASLFVVIIILSLGLSLSAMFLYIFQFGVQTWNKKKKHLEMV